MIDRHGNDVWAVRRGRLSCGYTSEKGEQCLLPWDHAEPHREPASHHVIVTYPYDEATLHELLDLTDYPDRSSLAFAVGERIESLFDTLDQISEPSDSWVQPMLQRIVIDELAEFLQSGGDLLTDEDRSRIVVVLASR